MELNTAYGNTIISAKTNAFLRGSGQYNTPPNYEQTVDRGNAYVNALNVYENDNKNVKSDPETMPIYEEQLKQWHDKNKTSYQVGDTGFHPENFDSWKRSEFGESEYQTWARTSVHQAPSVLLEFFFSTENVDYLQSRIVSEVKNIKNVDISKQSVDELLIIMRNHYLKALSGWLPHENTMGGTTSSPPRSGTQNLNEVYPRGETPCSLEGQISRLNKSVLEETVKQVLGSVDMYQQYYKDASSLPLPLTHPTLTSMKGSRVLSENVGFNSGHEFTDSIQSYNERYNIL